MGCRDWTPVDQSSTTRQWQHGTAQEVCVLQKHNRLQSRWEQTWGGGVHASLPSPASRAASHEPGVQTSLRHWEEGCSLLVAFLPDHWFEPFLSTCQLFCSTASKSGSTKTPLSVIYFFFLQLKTKLKTSTKMHHLLAEGAVMFYPSSPALVFISDHFRTCANSITK